MRVLWCSAETPDVHGHGGQRRQFHEVKALQQRGFDLSVLYLQSKQNSESIGSIVAESYGFRAPRRRHPLAYAAARSEFARICRQIDADVIVVCHPESFSTLRSWSFPRGTPVVTNFQNVNSEFFSQTGYDQLARHYSRIENNALRRSAGVFVLSERDRELLTLSPGVGCAVWPNGIDPDEWAEPPAGRPDPVLLFFGSLWYQVNLTGLLWFLQEVWPGVLHEHPEAEVHLIGQGEPPASVRSVVGVKCRGWVPRIDVVAARVAGIVIPIFEGPGARVKFPEALATGRPVIATNFASLSTPADGLFLACDDAASFVAGCSRALEAGPNITEMGLRARTTMLTTLTWTATSLDAVRLLEQLASGRSPATGAGSPAR